MRITIAGGTGFIGRFITDHYLKQGHDVTVIGRSTDKIKQTFNNRVKALDWESLNTSSLENTSLLINLTGANIADKRWSPKRKQEIVESRTQTTSILANLCAKLGVASPPLFNASAVGIYGIQRPQAAGLPPAFDETTSLDKKTPCFASNIVKQWEAAAKPAQDKNVRVVFMRFGVVLGKDGGALTKIIMPFHYFLGGKIGSGHQPFSWVCIVDLCRAINFLLDHVEIKGPVNIVAPECVTQAQLAATIGKVLNKPSFMTTPNFMLKFAFGDMAKELLLNGQHVVPKVLLQNGFTFQYPDLKPALDYALIS